jgi:hypothetical protein
MYKYYSEKSDYIAKIVKVKIASRHGESYLSVILAHARLRQDNLEFEANLGYIVQPCLKKTFFHIINFAD